ncbi:MAG: tyrosine recombinase XerD [SAR202 cluster bacterium]|nr:tyrosine recombinase XerD [SAR202 cluster bacterium]|tara:strand:- start:26621 stop:27568 length:948 start_codon:yes stop_codon:yes gene_type:complete
MLELPMEAEVQETIISFIGYLVSERGLSENTVTAYRNDLHQFLVFLELEKPSIQIKSNIWSDITPDDLKTYLLVLQQKDYSKTTLARKIASLKSLFGFLVDEGLINENPTISLVSPNKGTSIPKILTEKDIHSLLKKMSSDDSINGRRNLAMLELMYATGIRVSELVSLNTKDVNYEEGYIRCLGKGSKERLITIHEQARNTLLYYTLETRPLLAPHKKNTPFENALFLNNRGQRITRQGFWTIIKRCAIDANLKINLTPHTLRHSFATHMIQNGAPLRFLQEILGHSNISTTQVYTHMAKTHILREYDKAHPRA